MGSTRWLCAAGALVLTLALACRGGDDNPVPNVQAKPPVRDLAEALRAVPGVKEVKEEPAPEPGVRAFTCAFEQPLDHSAPGGRTFRQSFGLRYRSSQAPMVLAVLGYDMPEPFTEAEPARLLGANQVKVEHRYFGTSNPESAPWEDLNIRQAATDLHALVLALKPLFPGPWLSTGESKGGGAAVYHRRFFPRDVAGTVAYASPNDLDRADKRYTPFLESLGGEGVAQRLRAWQQAVLDHWDAVRAIVAANYAQRGLSPEPLGLDKCLQLALVEGPFNLWQNHGAALAAEVPDADAPAEQLFAFLSKIYAPTGVTGAFNSYTFTGYQPYFYQAATQLGYPAQREDHLKGLPFPGLSDLANLPPFDGVPKVHDPAPMRDIQHWVDISAERILFLYGGKDPFTAAAFTLTHAASARDNHLLVAPGANHWVTLEDLPEDRREAAKATLRRWATMRK